MEKSYDENILEDVLLLLSQTMRNITNIISVSFMKTQFHSSSLRSLISCTRCANSETKIVHKIHN